MNTFFLFPEVYVYPFIKFIFMEMMKLIFVHYLHVITVRNLHIFILTKESHSVPYREVRYAINETYNTGTNFVSFSWWGFRITFMVMIYVVQIIDDNYRNIYTLDIRSTTTDIFDNTYTIKIREKDNGRSFGNNS